MNWILVLVSFVISSFHGMWQTVIAPTLGLIDSLTSPAADDIIDIPRGLLIGAGISSFQHEGAWNISDKAPSHFDYKHPRHPTTNFYYKYKQDINLLKDVGFDSFRFSINWARLLPNGTSDYVSKDGLRFYNNVLDELEKRGIKPFVMIYDWDHPQKFEEQGGWLNETMIYQFADYSRVVFREFGNRVKYFGTINKPEVYCSFFKLSDDIPQEVAQYKCHQNMLKAHALAYHIYDKEFRKLQNGQVGLIIQCNTYYPYSEDQKDFEASTIAHEFKCGWTANLIFSETGDYPKIMKTRIARRSTLQGYNDSRLPELSREWIDKIRNSSDFFGLSHFTSKITEQSNKNLLDWPNDEGILYSDDPTWPRTQRDTYRVVPRGFGDVLRTIKNKYNNIPVYVVANGVSLGNGTNDDFRLQFFHSYMKEMLVAITRDKCNVKMYSIWSFLDSSSWDNGNEHQLGIVEVDYQDSNRRRTLKKSALWFQGILASRKLLPPDSVKK